MMPVDEKARTKRCCLDAMWMRDRQRAHNACTHGKPDEVSPVDLQVINNIDQRKFEVSPVVAGVVRFSTVAVSGKIDQNDSVVSLEVLEDCCVKPHSMRLRETMHKNYRFSATSI